MKREYFIGSIRVSDPTSTSMEGKYSIWGVSEHDCEAGIIVKEHIDLASTLAVRESKGSDTNASIDVTESIDLEATVSVKQGGRLDLHGTMGVTPKNIMWGQYEVIEPLPIIHNLYAEKDTYLRSQRPRVNYGRENSLLVGNNFGDEYRTLIKYDIGSIPDGVEIRRVSLVLKGIESINQFDISIHNVLDAWEEYSSTWANSPRVGEELTSFKSGSSYNEVRVDISSTYFAWKDGLIENNGIYLIKKDTDEVGTRTYGSRESILTHYIEVEYLDPSLYSFNNSYALASLRVGEYFDLKGQLEVRPTEWHTETSGELYVRDPENMPAYLVVNQPNLYSQMVVKYTADGKLDAVIRVPEYGDDDLLGGQVYVRANGRHDLKSTLTVEYKLLTETQLEVRPTLDVEASLMIPYPETYDGLNMEFEILDGYNIPSSLHVASVEDFNASISVTSNEDTEASLFVKYEEFFEGKLRVTPVLDIPSTLGVKVNSYVDENMQFTVTKFKDQPAKVRVSPYSDLPSTVGVRVDGQTDFNASLFVDYALTTPMSLYVRSDDLIAEMAIRNESYLDTEASIFLRFGDYMDMGGHIHPRVVGYNDAEAHLRPRVNGVHYTRAFFSVRVGDTHDLDVFIDVEEIKFRGYVFIM